MHQNNIKSEILKQNWQTVQPIYLNLLSVKEKTNNEQIRLNSTSKAIAKEWNNIYPQFVLKPYEESVNKLFLTLQTNGYEKEKDIKSKISVFDVYYYTAQYFYLFVLPNECEELHNEFPRFEIKTNDENLMLYNIFREIWFELYPNFDENEYYNLVRRNLQEYEMLYDFLSRCWLNSQKLTKSNVIATLSEATGCGSTVYLDGSNRLY